MALRINHNFQATPTLDQNGLDLGAAYTRTSLAITEDRDGWLRTCENNKPRWRGADWNNNAQRASNDFSDVSEWTNLNCTVAQNATDYLGNANTAWTLTADGLGGGLEVVGPRGDSFTGKNYREDEDIFMAIDVKAGTADWFLIYNGNASQAAWFNVSTGSVGTKDANVYDSGMIDLGNGWYRCYWIGPGYGASATRFYMSAADADNTDGWTNTSSGDVLYISRAQVSVVSGKDRVNILGQTDLTTGWNHLELTTTTGQADPFGGTDAVKFEVDATGNFKAIREPNYLAGDERIFVSVYAKAGVGRYLTFYLGSGIDVGFDLQTGTTLNDQGASGYGVIDSGMIDAGDGWYRCWGLIEAGGEDDLIDYPYWCVANALGSVACTAGDTITCYGPMIEYAKPNQTLPSDFISNDTSATKYVWPTPTYLETDGTSYESEMSGGCEGLEVEAVAYTNLITYSEDFAQWTEVNAASTFNTGIAPDGSRRAALLTSDNLGGNTIYFSNTLSLSTTTSYIVSVFLKAGTKSWARLVAGAFTGVTADVYYDLHAGTVGTASVDVDDSGIEDAGNGWWRCWFVFGTAADGAGALQVRMADADLDDSVTNTGNETIKVWGASVVNGSTLNQYTRTAGGSTTVQADDNLHVVNDTAVASLLSETAGTLYCRFTPKMDAAQNLWGISSEDGITDMQGMYASTANMAWRGRQTTVDQYNVSVASVLTRDTESISVGVYEENRANAWVDTTAGTEDTSVGLPSAGVLDSVHLGTRGFTTNTRWVVFHQIAYWDEAFNDPTAAGVADGTISVDSASSPAYLRKKARARWRARYGRH